MGTTSQPAEYSRKKTSGSSPGRQSVLTSSRTPCSHGWEAPPPIRCGLSPGLLVGSAVIFCRSSITLAREDWM